MSYQKAATYLRVHGAKLDKEFQNPGKTNKIEKDDGDKFLSYEESREVFTAMANESGAVRAFKVLGISQGLESHYISILRFGEGFVKKYRQKSGQLRKI